MGLKEKLSFSRDRLVENYLWAMGFSPEPHFSKCRIGLTKFICIFSAVDDMYDIYGSPDELRRFTDVVNRYEIYWYYYIIQTAKSFFFFLFFYLIECQLHALIILCF